MSKQERTRRGDREGSFYYDAKRKRWRARAQAGYKPDGKPRTITVYGRTRREAAQKLAERLTAHSAGTLPAPGKVTVREYLAQWLDHKKHFGGRDGKGLRPNSYRALEVPIRRHILPSLGDKLLHKVTAQDLRRLYADYRANRPPTARGNPNRTPEIMHKILNAAFAAAVKEKLVAENPAQQIADPPRTNYKAEDRPWLEWQMIPRVLAEVKDTPLYIPVLLAMAAGLRRGEVLGLRWRNVDLENGVLHIREQWNRDIDGVWRLSPVKTDAGRRDVPIPPDVVAALRKHKVQQVVVGMHGFVNERGDDTPLSATDFSKGWAAVRDRLGLDPNLTLHDLRGSFLTWLAERGVDAKAAAEIAGHADVGVVWRHYQKVSKRMRDEAARALTGITGTESGPSGT